MERGETIEITDRGRPRHRPCTAAAGKPARPAPCRGRDRFGNRRPRRHAAPVPSMGAVLPSGTNGCARLEWSVRRINRRGDLRDRPVRRPRCVTSRRRKSGQSLHRSQAMPA